VSNCIVVLLRLITSAIIRTDSTTYAPFLFDPETGDEVSPREFCERYVEAVGKEAGIYTLK
jgi:ubiquitin thioesterase protein OTUB1